MISLIVFDTGRLGLDDSNSAVTMAGSAGLVIPFHSTNALQLVGKVTSD